MANATEKSGNKKVTVTFKVKVKLCGIGCLVRRPFDESMAIVGISIHNWSKALALIAAIVRAKAKSPNLIGECKSRNAKHRNANA